MRKISACILLFLGAIALTADTSHDYRAFEQKLSKDDQALHALQRLTFGPRPGDLETIKRVGVKKWIDLQLHPEQIAENPEVEARLKPLETLRMSAAETIRTYPRRPAIKAIANGKQPPPQDPITRSAVERLAERLKAKKAQTTPDERPIAQTAPLLTPEQMRSLRNGTPEEKKAILEGIPEDQMDETIVSLPQGIRSRLLQDATPELRRKLLLANNPQQVLNYDLNEGKFYRAIYSNRQLQEELVDFWYNHFNVYLDKGADRTLVASYEREAIRPHVLGHFRDLLEATANSPAMMFYLDNWQSVAPDQVRRPNGKKPTRGLNENYARELMELHTLGVDGGYSQQDIIEVARCFTGWTLRPAQGQFEYNDRVHDNGQKIILGVTIPAGGGKEDGEKVLDILARHPSAARFISKELAVRFVADDPPPSLIDAMAKTFLATNGDIRAVMSTMLNSKEFFSQGAFHAKVKSPFEMMVSSLRATDAQIDFVYPLGQRMNEMGQPLYRKLEPTGYSNANAEWVSSSALLARMNFAIALSKGTVPGLKVDASKYHGSSAEVARQILFAEPSKQTFDAISSALQKETDPEVSENTVIAGLVLGSPDFQRK
jgi:uncharacterized protein (DUF1800 family)